MNYQTDLIALRCLQETFDFTQITLRVIFVVKFVQSTDLGPRKTDAAEVIVGCVLQLMDGSYF